MGGFTSCFGTCCRAIVDQDILDGGNNEGGPFAEVKVNCTLACCQSQALEKRGRHYPFLLLFLLLLLVILVILSINKV